ncbi:hypothetical protein ACS5PU_02580 [Pedobacter sp. GSP4]|uniref:hypothetical protein n=1 Tax=Pedobacter sp. GSP4 TaxID=3453716 RepID=UPI003EED3501
MKPKSYSLFEAYQYLKKYQLSDSLYLIGAVNAALKYGPKHLNKDNLPQEVLIWLGRATQENIRFNIYTAATQLARLLLLSGTNDHRGAPLSLLDNSLPLAIDVAGFLYDPELESQLQKASSNLSNNILGRIGQIQFPLQGNRLTLLGRAMLLFEILPGNLGGLYSIDHQLKAYFGMSVMEFLATGLALWIKCDGSIDYNLEIDDRLNQYVNNDTQMAFLKLSSGSPEDYRKIIRGENWKVPNKLYDIYFLEPLLHIPAIKVEVSSTLKKGSYVVPQPKYLLDRTSTGIFYLLADKEQQLANASGQTKKNPFRVYFGEVYRSYVKTQLIQANSSTILIDLDEDFDNKNGGKLPDFAIIEGHTCILIEVKTSLLTLKSRAFFDESQMEQEIKKGSFKKAIIQLHDFRTRTLQKKIEDPRFEPITEVITILAGYEDIFVLNSYLLPMLEVQYGSMTERLQLACISDVDAIGSILAEGKPLAKLLMNKVNNTEEKKWMLDQYLRGYIQEENPVIKRAFNLLMARLGA